jgi:hypothetical protein
MMISISTHFDRTTLERAEAYVRAGYVLALEPNGRGGLEARVRNETGTVYQQSISLEAPSARHPKGRVHGICCCPMHAHAALLHKSPDCRTSPIPGQTYPTTSMTGMPRAVKPFRTATLTWNSAA